MSYLLYSSRSDLMLSGGAREFRDNVSGLPIIMNKGIMGWTSTNQETYSVGPVVSTSKTHKRSGAVMILYQQKTGTGVTACGALHASMPGTVLVAPLPAFPNETKSLVANIKPTTALQDLRGGTVERGGPMEPSTHWTCGSYEARATPKLSSSPGGTSVSELLVVLPRL